jgi:hypothetical protein
MADSELIVAVVLIFIGIFYILERMLHLAAFCFSWYYNKDTGYGDNNEPGEERNRYSNKHKIKYFQTTALTWIHLLQK